MKKTYRANVVLPDKILYNGFLSVEGGIITRVSAVAPENGEITELSGYLLAGFIDIHCHANADLWAQEDPQAVAEYHLAHGTTGMLLTFYRDIPHEKLLSALNAVKRTMTGGCR